MKTVAGIDLGTQSIKVVLYDVDKESFAARASSPLAMTARDDGTREQEASWYVEGLRKCFAALDPDVKRTIAAVGVSGQQHGFVPLDGEGRPLYAVKLWCDTSTTAECTEITRAAGGESVLLDRIGNLMLPGYTAPKILWLKKNRPEAFASLRHVLLPHDYLNFLLTGRYCAEYGDASGTALFDVRTRTWADDIAALIDPKLPSCLPPLVNSSAPAGYVTVLAARRLGIPEGIPVSSGGGDNMMGAVGTGTVRDGILTVSLGTSGTLFGYSDVPVVDPHGRIAAFCSSTGGWLPLLCTMNCTVATEKARELFAVDLETLERTASRAPAGSRGVVTLPFYGGERTPNLPRGRASLMGLTSSNLSRENILRSAMEAAVFGLRGGLDAFRSLGFAPGRIRITGGGARSPLWRSITADILGLPVDLPAGDEGAAFGAALQALWCESGLAGRGPDINEIVERHVRMDTSGSVLPDRKTAGIYDGAYALYSSYLEAVKPLYV